MNVDRVIEDCCKTVVLQMSGVDYLEKHFRTHLSRLLRSQLLTACIYEEVPITYSIGSNMIPMGYGLIDIVIDIPNLDTIILELKITGKDCSRQLKRYLRHWDYTPNVYGYTVNFTNDSVSLQKFSR